MAKHQFTITVPREVTTTVYDSKTIVVSNGVRMALREFLFPFSGTPNKVGAIKTVRAELDIGLKEAKDIVDQIERNQVESLYPFVEPAQEDKQAQGPTMTLSEKLMSMLSPEDRDRFAAEREVHLFFVEADAQPQQP